MYREVVQTPVEYAVSVEFRKVYHVINGRYMVHEKYDEHIWLAAIEHPNFTITPVTVLRQTYSDWLDANPF
jgi:hypothetical protein